MPSLCLKTGVWFLLTFGIECLTLSLTKQVHVVVFIGIKTRLHFLRKYFTLCGNIFIIQSGPDFWWTLGPEP